MKKAIKRLTRQTLDFALVAFVAFIIIISVVHFAVMPYVFPYQVGFRRIVLLEGGVPAEEVNVENTTIYRVTIPDMVLFILNWIVNRAWAFMLLAFFIAFLDIKGEEEILKWSVRIGVTAQWAGVFVYLYELKIGLATAGAISSILVGWVPFLGDAVTSALESVGEAVEAAILFAQFLYTADLLIVTFLSYAVYWTAKYILRLFAPRIATATPFGIMARLLAGAFVVFGLYETVIKPIAQLIATLTWGLVQVT